MRSTYYVIAWTQQQPRGRRPVPREYGTASSKQAAIHLAERVLPPEAEYLITTTYRTVHHGHTPPAAGHAAGSGRSSRPTPAASNSGLLAAGRLRQ